MLTLHVKLTQIPHETRSSMAETKTYNTTSTSSSNASFYSDTFLRPPTKVISFDLFKTSTTAMIKGINRNPFAHWTHSDLTPIPICKHEFSRHKFAFCADCKQQCISLQQVAKEEDWSRRIQEEDASRTQHMSTLHALGVTTEWLLAFTFDHNCWEKPTWWVNRHIIKEATRHNRRRYMDLDDMKQYARPATVFISHCWGATWGDVVLAACHGARRGRVVWIDLFAVRQWPGNDADLNFRGLIDKCEVLIVSVSPVDGLKKLLLQTDDRNAYLASGEGKAAKKRIPVFRLWCNVEIAAAYKKIPIVVKGGKATKEETKEDNNNMYIYDTKCVGDLMQNLQYMIDVEASETTNQDDYVREMKAILQLEGGIEGVNALVAGVVNGATTSILNNVLEIDTYMCNEKESFRELVKYLHLGCEGEERELSIKLLSAACSGGRANIVSELLLKWNGNGNDGNGNKEEKQSFNENNGRLYFVCIDDLGVGCRNSPVMADRCERNMGCTVSTHECVVGTVTKNGKWICIVESNHRKQHGKYLPITKGKDILFKRITTKIEMIELQKYWKKNWLALLIKDSCVLMLSSIGGHCQVVDMLLKVRGVKVKNECLLQACLNNHLDVVSILVQQSDIDINEHEYQLPSHTPLYIASSKGHGDIVAFLLNCDGIDVNAGRRYTCNHCGLWTYSDTPMRAAYVNGHKEIVKLLNNAGGRYYSVCELVFFVIFSLFGLYCIVAIIYLLHIGKRRDLIILSVVIPIAICLIILLRCLWYNDEIKPNRTNMKKISERLKRRQDILDSEVNVPLLSSTCNTSINIEQKV